MRLEPTMIAHGHAARDIPAGMKANRADSRLHCPHPDSALRTCAADELSISFEVNGPILSSAVLK